MKNRSLLLSAFDPLRSRVFLAYARLLPRWSHPFLDLLDQDAHFSGHYVRLALANTLVSLSLALFIRVLIGQLVPAGNVALILCATLLMALLMVCNGVWLQPLMKRLQLSIFVRVHHRIRRTVLPYLFSPSRLAQQGSMRAENSLSVPNAAAQLTAFALLPLLADLPAVLLMVLGFLLLAGPAYAPLLMVYVFYVGLDLFYAYARRQVKDPLQSQVLWRSLLRVYHMHKETFDRNRLFRHVAPRVFNAYGDDYDQQRRESEGRLEMSASTEATTDFVTVVIILLAGVLVISEGLASGALLAGLLVLLKLTPLVKRTYRDYQALRRDCLRLTWFGDVYRQIDAERMAQLSRALPVSSLREINQLQTRSVSLSIATPAIPQSSPQLRGITLQLKGPGLMAFTGRSGAGKSSLLRVLTGVYPISSGQCLYNGFDSQQLSEEQVRRRALFVDREVLQLSPKLLQGFLPDGGAADGPTYTRNLLTLMLTWERGWLLALDEPEQWLPQLGLHHELALVLRQLAERHLLLVSSRQNDTLRLADRLFLLEEGRCRELQAFQQLRDGPQSAHHHAVSGAIS